jgi:hypothetical protein
MLNNIMYIIFHSNQLGIRGTEIALYDMAHYNETILGNISYITAPKDSDMSAYEKFNTRFKSNIFLYDKFSDVERFCIDKQINFSYLIKAGHNDGKLISGVKNLVHVVFDGSQPHGDEYLAVSKWLGDQYQIDYMPHIVSLPESTEDYRSFLHIPKDAIVFGRHGGYDQFDVPYLSEAIYDAAKEGRYFLLMNTARLKYDHPNIIYLDATTDLYTKAAFINTCDAMVHGRTEGETFGLAICEFLHQNKPIITNINCRDRHHIELLGDKGYYYNSTDGLYNILINLEKKDYQVKSLVDQFKPEVVMEKFKQMLND